MEKEKDLSIPEVTSTNTEVYRLLQADVLKMVSGEKEKMVRQRFSLPFAYPEFRALFIDFGTYCLLGRNYHGNFVIDAENEPLIEQLYYYATNNSAFAGDLNKGIMLQGKYGCGKTVILEAYYLLHNHIIQKYCPRFPLLTFVKSIELQEQIIKQSAKAFERRPLIIDEFGRESKTVQDYGNIMRPIQYLLNGSFSKSNVARGNWTSPVLTSCPTGLLAVNQQGI